MCEQDLLLNATLRVGGIAIKESLRVTLSELPYHPRENLPLLVEEALRESETTMKNCLPKANRKIQCRNSLSETTIFFNPRVKTLPMGVCTYHEACGSFS